MEKSSFDMLLMPFQISMIAIKILVTMEEFAKMVSILTRVPVPGVSLERIVKSVSYNCSKR